MTNSWLSWPIASIKYCTPARLAFCKLTCCQTYKPWTPSDLHPRDLRTLYLSDLHSSDLHTQWTHSDLQPKPKVTYVPCTYNSSDLHTLYPQWPTPSMTYIPCTHSDLDTGSVLSGNGWCLHTCSRAPASHSTPHPHLLLYRPRDGLPWWRQHPAEHDMHTDI